MIKSDCRPERKISAGRNTVEAVAHPIEAETYRAFLPTHSPAAAVKAKQMTWVEKIGDLRRDVIRVCDAYNVLSQRLNAGSAHLGEVAMTASEASRAVNGLEARLLTLQDTE